MALTTGSPIRCCYDQPSDVQRGVFQYLQLLWLIGNDGVDSVIIYAHIFAIGHVYGEAFLVVVRWG